MKHRIATLMSNNFSAKYRIYYEDTDAGGVVYYANYLKFFERARTDFLRALGISQSELSQKESLVFVVRKCEIEYVFPARLDDEIEVSVEVKEVRPASILMAQKMTKSEKILSTLNIKIACINSKNFKPEKIPNALRLTPYT